MLLANLSGFFPLYVFSRNTQKSLDLLNELVVEQFSDFYCVCFYDSVIFHRLVFLKKLGKNNIRVYKWKLIFYNPVDNAYVLLKFNGPRKRTNTVILISDR